MNKAINNAILHVKEAKHYAKNDIEADLGCSLSDINHYVFITKIIRSDLIPVIANKLRTIANIMSSLYKKSPHPTQEHHNAMRVLCVLLILIKTEQTFIKTFRIRSILFKTGIIEIINTLIEISNLTDNYLAEHIINMTCIMLPCINTIESHNFFNVKCGGLNTKYIIRTCKKYFGSVSTEHGKHIMTINARFNSHKLGYITEGVITMCTYLLSFDKYRKKILIKKLYADIVLILFTTLRIFCNVFSDMFGREIPSNLGEILKNKPDKERLEISNKLFKTEPLQKLYPILRRCLEFMYILKNDFDVTLLQFYHIPTKIQNDFKTEWNTYARIVFVIMIGIVSDFQIVHWFATIDGLLNEVSMLEAVGNDGKCIDALEIPLEIESEELYIPDKCFHSKCSKSSKDRKLKKCSGCLCAFYCNRECQKRDWHRHKRCCRKW